MSNCGCGVKDQTPRKELRKFLEANKLAVRDIKDGIGVFLVPAPENGEYEVKKIVVENLSYNDTKTRGQLCLAFQWIPKEVVIEIAGKKVSITSKSDVPTPTDCRFESCGPTGCHTWGCVCYERSDQDCH